jgi:hypothetical protein
MPSWGLVDDWSNLGFARTVWSGGDLIGGVARLVHEGTKLGMFRPLYYLYVSVAYHIFGKSPLSLYVIIALFNLSTILLWGYVLDRVFLCRGDRKTNIFIYPLTFFLFTPFWNIFMYISSQQKFIIFFSALAVSFYNSGYTNNSRRYMLLSFVAVLCGMLFHPEGVFMNIALLIASAMLFVRDKKRALLFAMVVSAILLVVYLFLTVTVQLKGTYTAPYASGLYIFHIFDNLRSSPLAVKLIAGISALYLIYFAVSLKRSLRLPPVFVVIPLSCIFFIAVMVPWGFPNYHLSVLTPFVAGMLFPAFRYFYSVNRTLKSVSCGLIFIASLIVILHIWFPRVSKMSDVGKTALFVSGASGSGVYFVPHPGMEACAVLSEITGKKTVYLNDSLLSADKTAACRDNYLVLRDEFPEVRLEGVEVCDKIYRNNTWEIFVVREKKGFKGHYRALFPQSPVNAVKNFLKR